MAIDIKLILELHAKWLKGEPDGKKADLSKADLSWADLSEADLSWADLSWANLSKADLSKANLSWANLSKANLSWADLDFSFGWQFHCRFSRFTASSKFYYQVLAHLASLNPAEGDEEEIQKIKDAILEFARKSHRAKDLGILEMEVSTK